MIKLNKNIFLVFILLLCFSNTNCYNVPPTQDTAKTHILDELATRMAKPKEFKISRNKFLNSYGFDEVSVKKIKTFFKLRNLFVFFIISPILVVAIFFLIFYILILAEIISFFTGRNRTFDTEKLAIPFVILYSASWLGRVYSLIRIWKFKKYNLLIDLVEYRKQYNLNLQKND